MKERISRMMETSSDDSYNDGYLADNEEIYSAREFVEKRLNDLAGTSNIYVHESEKSLESSDVTYKTAQKGIRYRNLKSIPVDSIRIQCQNIVGDIAKVLGMNGNDIEAIVDLTCQAQMSVTIGDEKFVKVLRKNKRK